MTIGKVIGMAITLLLIYLMAKEIYKAIKESNEGRCSDRCDLD
jgi:hypothetical protein